ncbi:MAG TPA: energy transducer TonB [Rhodocyclaceae bacterium]|nr:energy transducer TonB [Rhodocyclaceae bacterium]
MSGHIVPIDVAAPHTRCIPSWHFVWCGKNFRVILAYLLSVGIHLFIVSQPIPGQRGFPGAGPRSPIQLKILANQAPASLPPRITRTEPAAGDAPAADAQAVLPETPSVSPQAPSSTSAGEAILDFGVMPYLPANMLDIRPAVVIDIPADPENLREYDIGGEMIVTLWISATGAVDAVSAEYSNLPPGFQERALKHFYAMRFTPGKIGDKSVPTALRIQVNFSQRGSTNSEKASK